MSATVAVRGPLLVALAITALACTDPVTSDGPVPKMREAGLAQLASERQTTLAEAYRSLAARLPGFAGVSLDTSGTVLVSSTQELSTSTEETVRGWLIAGGRVDLAQRPMRGHRVKYDYLTLDRTMARIVAETGRLSQVRAVGISEALGDVVVHVESSTDSLLVATATARLKLASDLIRLVVVGPVQDAQGLQGQHSVMRGGLQINRQMGNPGSCSIGLVGWAVDTLQPSQPDYGRRVITTASHCTTDQRNVLGDVFGQPDVNRVVAVEIDEARVYPGPGHPCSQGMTYCRYADVAVLLMVDSVASAAGSAARSSATTPPNNPPYLGAQPYTGSGVIGAIVGEKVIRVGRTTGQRGPGTITLGCVTYQSTLSPGLYSICQQHAVITIGSGDSGGTVYIASGASYPPNPRPAGVAIAGGTNVLYFSPMNSVLGSLDWKYFLAW